MIGRDVLEQVKRLLRPLQVRIANSIARGVIQLVDDSTKQQLLQLGVLAGEDVDDCERFQDYGFFSVPFAGAEAVVIFPNGDRGHPLVVAVTDRRYRPTGGQPGEAGLHTDEGDEIRLARGHVIVITTSEIRAGSAAAVTPVALASELAAVKAAFALFTPSSADGTAIKAIFAAWAAPGATKLKAE